MLRTFARRVPLKLPIDSITNHLRNHSLLLKEMSIFGISLGIHYKLRETLLQPWQTIPTFHFQNIIYTYSIFLLVLYGLVLVITHEM
jgi:hypothetical protein